MRKKYFFFDIDNTLLPHSISGDDSMPESTVRAITQLKQRGHFCAIAIGRAHCLATDQARKLGFENMVAAGGIAYALKHFGFIK